MTTILVNVPHLMDLCLSHFSLYLNHKFSQQCYSDHELRSLVAYIKTLIPKTQYFLVLKMLRMKHWGKHIRAPELPIQKGNISSDSVWFNILITSLAFGETRLSSPGYNQNTAKMLDSLDFSCFKFVSIMSPHGHHPSDSYLHCIINHVCTMTNVTNLCTNLCNNELLKVIGRSCSNLQKLKLYSSIYDHKGVISLCGFKPSDVRSYEDVRGFLHKSKTVCNKLTHLSFHLNYEDVYAAAVALSTFSALQYLDIDGISSGFDVLLCIYGNNIDRYQYVTHRYNLTYFEESYPMVASHLMLLVKVCPHLTKLVLTFNEVERFDKNLLAELLPLEHLTGLTVTSVNMAAMFWFLERGGAGLTHLSINNRTLGSFTRSQLAMLDAYCPKLQRLALKIFVSNIISDVPYSDGSFDNVTEFEWGEVLDDCYLTTEDYLYFLSWRSLKTSTIYTTSLSCEEFRNTIYTSSIASTYRTIDCDATWSKE